MAISAARTAQEPKDSNRPAPTPLNNDTVTEREEQTSQHCPHATSPCSLERCLRFLDKYSKINTCKSLSAPQTRSANHYTEPKLPEQGEKWEPRGGGAGINLPSQNCCPVFSKHALRSSVVTAVPTSKEVLHKIIQANTRTRCRRGDCILFNYR